MCLFVTMVVVVAAAVFLTMDLPGEAHRYNSGQGRSEEVWTSPEVLGDMGCSARDAECYVVWDHVTCIICNDTLLANISGENGRVSEQGVSSIYCSIGSVDKVTC
jgi:hypothetical protein